MTDQKAVSPPNPLAHSRSEADGMSPSISLPLLVVDRTAKAPDQNRQQRLGGRGYFPVIQIIIAVFAALAIFYGYRFLAPPGSDSARNTQAADLEVAQTSRPIVGLASLLPEGEVITLAPPYGAGDARIEALLVREGEQVAKGTLLAILDNRAQLEAALGSAQASVRAREAILAQTRASIRSSFDEASASFARAQATADNALRDFERTQNLKQTGFASDTAFEQKRTARDEALKDAERAKATMLRYSGDPESQVDVMVAARNLEVARADTVKAQADLEKAYIRAPMEGTVLTIQSHAGEKPASKGIMTFGNLAVMNAAIEIYQTYIHEIKIGQNVEIKADSLPRPLKGKIVHIGLEIGKQVLVDPNPAANTDARVLKVRARLDPASSQIAGHFTYLQVIATIERQP